MRGQETITIAPRFILGLSNDWKDTSLDLPEGNWHNILTQEKVSGQILLQKLFKKFPVALLAKV